MRRASIAISLIALSAAGGASAHHSYGMFDRSADKVVAGTVVKFDWTNPHSWVYVTAPGQNGAVQTWGVEMGPPGQLVRTGWKKNSLKPGDKVELTISPLKDGTSGGHLISVKTANGELLYDVVFKKDPSTVPRS